MYQKAFFRGTHINVYLYDNAIPAARLHNKKNSTVIASKIYIPPQLYDYIKNIQTNPNTLINTSAIHLYLIGRCHVLENRAYDYVGQKRHPKLPNSENPYNFYIMAFELMGEYYRFKCSVKHIQLTT